MLTKATNGSGGFVLTMGSTLGIFVSVCVDPDDDKFIECALASNSKVIVSGR